uniref:Peptidase M10 metallopeptidase domain-containing protein n=1 Tax=Acrobeloides nanus TaxID=290746 RepID=A0A914EMP9_9BILA
MVVTFFILFLLAVLTIGEVTYHGDIESVTEDSVEVSYTITESFQEFLGLEPTGRLDSETKAKIAHPRCGVPDVNSNPLAMTQEYKWQKSSLTYSIKNYTNDVTKQTLSETHIDLLNTAVHEIGHALGLFHIGKVESAIMAPYYKPTIDPDGSYMPPRLTPHDVYIFDSISDSNGKFKLRDGYPKKTPINKDINGAIIIDDKAYIFSLFINGEPIEQVDCFRYLIIDLDPKLSYKHH